MALIVQKVYFRAMTSVMLCCLEQEECLWQWGTSRTGIHFKKESHFPRSALQWRMQCTARTVAVHCGSGCSALRPEWQN